MTIIATFAPTYTKGVAVSPAASSASTQVGEGSKTICLTNTGTGICYVRTGVSGVAATTADYPVLAGSQVTISKPQDHTHVAYISAAGTTLHIIPGEGF